MSVLYLNTTCSFEFRRVIKFITILLILGAYCYRPFCYHYSFLLRLNVGWYSVVVTALITATKLSYVEPG